jgi:hypothetical protein
MFLAVKFQARESNEEKNKMKGENSEGNQYEDKVCFLLSILAYILLPPNLIC